LQAVQAGRATQPTGIFDVLLFTPHVARLFARGDRIGVEHVYWQTSGSPPNDVTSP
jgi:hypothetical protein